METSLCKHDLITLLAIGNQFHLQSLSPPGRSGVGLKVPSLYLRLVPQVTSPLPQVQSKSHLINITKDTFIGLMT